MLNLKPELRENETVLGEYLATVHRVRGNAVRGSAVQLWLTNQRLILKAALGPQRTLPLYAIANFHEEKASIYTLVRFEFTNGDIVWLTVRNQAQFLEALKEAQAQAPVIPEEPSPATMSNAIPSLFGGGLAFIAVIAIIVLICACLFIAAFAGLWYIAQTA